MFATMLQSAALAAALAWTDQTVPSAPNERRLEMMTKPEKEGEADDRA
jgi:hypothetical protein